MGGDIGIFNNRVRKGTLQVHSSLFSSNKSKYGKIIALVVHVHIILALPDYSGEVIERLQNLFYGRLIHFALEFDVH